jgi:hypothetical protein
LKTGIALVLCFIFLVFGSVALGQQEVSNGTREYIGEVASLDMTPEELSEMEGEFYYNPATTNQYTPNIQKQAISSIIEMVQSGDLKIK